MIVEFFKKQYKASLSRRIYERVRNFSPVRLFFDFEYAALLWKKSFSEGLLEAAVRKLRKYVSLPYVKVRGKVFAAIIAGGIFAGFSSCTDFLVIPSAIIGAAIFCNMTDNENFIYVCLAELFFAAVFALIIPFTAFLYILYVETGIIFFFIIKYSAENIYLDILKTASVLMIAFSALPIGIFSPSALAVMLMPYSLTVLGGGKIRKYIYAVVLLSLGFYGAAKGGNAAVIGGSAGIIVMIILGEYRLLIPVLFSAPFIIMSVMDFLKSGDLAENIIRTGFFIWKYGFGGKIAYKTDGINLRYFNLVCDAAAAVAVIFFWYVLRLSRSVLVKMFTAKTANNRLLRSGLGSMVGFSVYTFFAYNGNLPINILLYLISAGLLKRACTMERIGE